MNILYLDKEGGFGGSSRSLFYLVKHLDRGEVIPVVIVGEEGPIIKKYRQLGIAVYYWPCFPIFKAVARNNFFMILRIFWDIKKYLKSIRFLRKIARKHQIDLVHINLESLFLLAILCRFFLKRAIILHVRTTFPSNQVARWQSRIMANVADRIVFISENELRILKRLGGKIGNSKYEIIHNIAEVGEKPSGIESIALPEDSFNVLFLGNISHIKGADLLLDISNVLKAENRKNIRFVLCGAEREHIKGILGASYFESLKGKMVEMALSDYFLFLGFQENPDPILSSSDMLVRVCRRNNPWGRDIIEALAFGKPVIATGSYDKFVEDGTNGYLFPKFDAEGIAEKICYLADNPNVVRKMGRANIEKANRLFNGRQNAGRMTAVYESIMSGSDGKVPLLSR
jgi:glycosyltransferase involved in cell wall biosynthesis